MKLIGEIIKMTIIKDNMLKSIFVMILMALVISLNIDITANAETFDGFKYRLINDKKEVEITGFASDNSDVVIPGEINNLKVTSIAKNSFKNNKTIKNVIVSADLKCISRYTFYGCTELTYISLSKSVTSIDYKAFYGCKKLEYINLNDNVTDIGEYAFYKCSSLKKVTFYDGLKTVGQKAFYNSGISTISLPASVEYIGVNAFNKKVQFTVVEGSYADKWAIDNDYIIVSHPKTEGQYIENTSAKFKVTSSDASNPTVEYVCPLNSKVTTVSIPSSVVIDKIKYSITSINNNAFLECYKLQSVTIPSSVTNIGSKVFVNCTKLKTIKVNSNNTVFNSKNNCNAIIETNSNTLIAGCYNTKIPGGVENIGDFAFQSCTKLKNITIPKSVKRIGRNAFINCALKSVSIPESVQDIDIDPFDKNVKIIAVSGFYAEKWAKDNGYSVIKCKGTTVKLDNKKAKFKIISDDVNDLQVEYAGTTDKKAKTIKIPASVKIDKVDYKVTAIAANALKGRKNIKKIIIKSTSLNKVGKNAIKDIDKKSVIIVPKKKVKLYKKLFNKKTGYKKSIKIKK